MLCNKIKKLCKNVSLISTDKLVMSIIIHVFIFFTNIKQENFIGARNKCKPLEQIGDKT